MKKPALFVCLALLLPALLFARVPHQVPYQEAEFAGYDGIGSGAVTGQFVTTDELGHSHILQGTDVILLPVNAYTRETIERKVVNGEDLARTDARVDRYRRVAKCDRAGNFAFAHVPAGDYFVVGLMVWVPSPEEDRYQWALEKIHLSKGQSVRIKLSRNPLRPGRPVIVGSAATL